MWRSFLQNRPRLVIRRLNAVVPFGKDLHIGLIGPPRLEIITMLGTTLDSVAMLETTLDTVLMLAPTLDSVDAKDF